MFQKYLFEPIYNLLVYLTDIVPGGNIGIAIIVVTIIIKIILFPLTRKFIHTQIETRALQPKLKEIQKKYKEDRQKLGEETMKLYKEHGVNPFSGILLLIIQIPILWAIFRVFRDGIDITQGVVPFKSELLYSFVSLPEVASTMFLGIDLVERSVLLAIVVGIAQYFYMKLLTPAKTDLNLNAKPDMAETMQKNMKIFMPAVTAVIAVSFPAALALYWLVNTLFSMAQEVLVRKGKKAKENELRIKESNKEKDANKVLSASDNKATQN